MTNSQHQSDFDSEDERTEIVWWYTNGVNKGSVKVTGITDEPIQHRSKWHHQVIGSGQVHYVLDTLSEEEQHLLPLWLVLRSVAEDFHLPLYLHKKKEKTKSNNNYFLLIEKNTSKGLILLFHASEVFGNFSASELRYSCTQAVVLSWTFSCLSTSETPVFLSA